MPNIAQQWSFCSEPHFKLKYENITTSAMCIQYFNALCNI